MLEILDYTEYSEYPTEALIWDYSEEEIWLPEVESVYMAEELPNIAFPAGFQLVLPGTLVAAFGLIIFLMSVTNTWKAPVSLAVKPVGLSSQPATEVQSKPEVGSPVEVAASPGCQVNPNFPPEILQWCDWITIYAMQHDLAPNLIAAIILQESGGNPTAFSKSGAVGLMQVMPRDGRASSFMCKNGPCFSDRPTIASLEDPEFNISYGTRMLAELLSKQGDMREALRSYGPMDVGYYYADLILGIYQRFGG